MRIADVAEICRISGVAGLNITVVNQGDNVFEHSHGYRDVARKLPITANTVFHIASLTKSFTGLCVHRLRAQGRLDLDDLIQKHLPAAKSRDSSDASLATIADLLGHRTGLQNANEIWLGAEGEIMFDRDQTATVFSNLLPRTSLRSRFVYNNIGYGTLGEIISEVAGQPYHRYLEQTILAPLGMTRTFVTKQHGLPDEMALSYSTLEDCEPYKVSLPGSNADAAMGAAGGLMSTSRDLVRYYTALMSAWQRQTGILSSSITDKDKKPDAVFDDISWLLSPLQIMKIPSFREQSYASGWVRSQLPATVGSLGVNPGLVDQMPTLAKGITSSPLALWHQGSLVGATSFVMLLPETESAVLVLCNTMAMNDPADWIGQLLVETLLDSPAKNDYVRLASMSADGARKAFAELSRKIDQGKKSGGPTRALKDYIGTYVGVGGVYRIVVEVIDEKLYVLFQGRESQMYQLRHHHDDTFTWFLPWNDQVKKGRFLEIRPDLFMLHFRQDAGNGINIVNWIYDSAVPAGRTSSKKNSDVEMFHFFGLAVQ